MYSISAYAWGPMGHDVVAAIAEQNLTRKAKRNIKTIRYPTTPEKVTISFDV